MLSVSPQVLSDILNKQFPELCDEVGIERSGPQRKIEPAVVENPELAGFDANDLITFKVYKEKLPQLEAKKDIIVAVSKQRGQQIEEGKYFLVQCHVRNVLECGRVCIDESLGLFFFENDGAPSPFTPKDVRVIGEIVGYCYKEESDFGRIEFKLLP